MFNLTVRSPTFTFLSRKLASTVLIYSLLNTPFTKRREIEVLPTRAKETTRVSESVVKGARCMFSISFSKHNFCKMLGTDFHRSVKKSRAILNER